MQTAVAGIDATPIKIATVRAKMPRHSGASSQRACDPDDQIQPMPANRVTFLRL
jgi:hypothetical protein